MFSSTFVFLFCAWGYLASLAPIVEAKAKILIYSATTGFRHDSIPTAIARIREKADTIGVEYDATEERSQFTFDNLSTYDAIIFLSTTGEVLGDGGKTALQEYLNHGGGFIAIHSSSDSLVNTTFYTRELGAVFDFHADLQVFSLNVLQPDHPSTADIPAVWRVHDEAYNFKSDPRAVGAVVVLSADDSTITGGKPRFNQGSPHPSAWYQEHGAGVQEGGLAGRSFYTSLGHLNETWQDDIFMTHILGGISWVLQGNTTLAFNSTAMVGNPQSQQKTTSSDSPSNSGATAPGPAAQPTDHPSSASREGISILLVMALVAPVVLYFWS